MATKGRGTGPQGGLGSVVEWETLVPAGPTLAFHAACILGRTLFLHGGLTHKENQQPSSAFFRLDLEELIWNEINAPGSPALSHHACLGVEGRYILLIGGWNGKSRESSLYAFDTQHGCWLKPSVSGYPDDGGLSSHTATLMGNGDIMVIGREGSLRSQRRFGNVYLLSGSVQSKFRYTEVGRDVKSRSGHTTAIMGTKLFILGGRSDAFLELYPEPTGSGSEENHTVLPRLHSLAASLPAMGKPPSGRKHHVAVAGHSVIFLHGGETFDGRTRVPVGEMFLMVVNKAITFHQLGTSRLGRAGHVCLATRDAILMHGGLSGKDLVCGDLSVLKVK